MRRILALALLLPLAACSSSKEASREPGYAVSENADGSIVVSIEEGASGETMVAALMAVADRLPWEPPEASGGLRQIRTQDLGGDGTLYRYSGLAEGRFDIFVYTYPLGVDAQVTETETALTQLVDDGRVDAFTTLGRETMAVSWEGEEATLYRIAFSEKLGGKPFDSYMYLLEDGDWWIKVRASYPQGRYALADLDAIVLGMLEEDDSDGDGE